MERYDRLLIDTKREFPKFELIKKSSCWHQKAIGWLLKAISFGKMGNFMDCYVTTIGQKVYVPDVWDEYMDENRYAILKHEREHMRQFRKYTFVGMSFLYLLVFFPIFLSYFRMKFEKEGYEATICATYELYGRDVAVGLKPWIVEKFVGPSYLWMWPFRKGIEEWFDGVITSIDKVYEDCRIN